MMAIITTATETVTIEVWTRVMVVSTLWKPPAKAGEGRGPHGRRRRLHGPFVEWATARRSQKALRKLADAKPFWHRSRR